MMENLEIEEEEDREREAENDEVQEVPVTRKPPAVEDDKKIQLQITSFLWKNIIKKHFISLTIFKNLSGFRQKRRNLRVT